jgi:hypothetical protein
MSIFCNLKLKNCRKLHVKFSIKSFQHFLLCIELFYIVNVLQNSAECDIFMLWTSGVKLCFALSLVCVFVLFVVAMGGLV